MSPPHPHDSCQSRYSLDGEPGTIRAARDHTRTFLEGCTPGLPEATTEDLILVVSELVTNAVTHAPGPLTLALSCNGHVSVAVTDTSVTAPTPRAPDLSGNGGFGWHLLSRLADRIDVHLDPPDSKTISAIITTP